jgi:aminoglycoside/choline kinase family phosphotransferase
VAERAEATAAFLAAHGWGSARREPLAGDASFRRYERLRDDNRRRAVLMDAPPPENVRPFLRVGAALRGWGLSAPDVLAADAEAGLLLLEDLGDDLFSRLLAAGRADEATLYAAAVDLLADLQRRPAPPGLPAYDDGRLLEEVGRLLLWYEPAAALSEAAKDAYRRLWLELFPRARVGAPCLVYVDYHADNLIWLPARAGHARVGLLDFQDARLGPPAYDLVSLLEDARRDVAPALAEAMAGRYLAARPELDPEAFRRAYAILGAQRNAKILGLFSRLARRDGKPAYLALQPRVRGYLERDLAHPALDAMRAWFEEHLQLAPNN